MGVHPCASGRVVKTVTQNGMRGEIHSVDGTKIDHSRQVNDRTENLQHVDGDKSSITIVGQADPLIDIIGKYNMPSNNKFVDQSPPEHFQASHKPQSMGHTAQCAQ